MTCLIVEFWRKCHGAIHPDDAEILASKRHTFNLDFPPPAYLGDPRTAPIIMLNANGGYDFENTPLEFDGETLSRAYLDRLHDPIPASFINMPNYYHERNYGRLILEGELALVNAIAYRSPRLSKEPENRQIAELLPSVAVHRRWLRDIIMPEAQDGRRLIIAHRRGMWRIPKSPMAVGLIRTPAPVSPDLDNETLTYALDWLDSQKG